MIRVLLAVAVTLALVAAATPAIDAARESRSERLVRTDLAAVERAATGLLASEEPTPGAGARRVVSVRLPDGTPTTSSVDWVAIGGRPGADDPDPHVLAYAVAGRQPRTVSLPVPVKTGGDPLVLHGPGTYELELTLHEDGVQVVRTGV
ncbi:DUF7311 family protein [Haloarchaeobius sp. HRN-SO-5]|uniref:DUF7311 family protein n=1 Tax=Haloarchaeobius sp. HRN-SO-5 TaxID=3446118 RepID=UPI003EB9B5F3